MIQACRSCGSSGLETVLSLGDQCLSDFRVDDSKPDKHPLEFLYCTSCLLGQLSHTAPAVDMYGPNYSFQSGISDAIRRDLADVAAYSSIAYGMANNGYPPKRWMDIASNDGSLLANVPPDVYRVGIDPLRQFAGLASNHANRIIIDFFDPKHFEGETFDVITSVSMFYDLDDPNTFVAGVASVLADRGVWVIQQNYLPTMLENKAVDNISHEHLGYHSLTSMVPLLERHGLEVVDVQLNPINGGCFRTAVMHRGTTVPNDSVKRMLVQESCGPLTPNAFKAFGHRAKKAIKDIRQAVLDANERGEQVWAYAASTRGAVILQAAGLDVNEIPYAVERNPAKVGRYMSAVGIPIISEEEMRKNPPENLLLLPYWIRDDVVKREADYLANGGKFIVPLPELEIVTA